MQAVPWLTPAALILVCRAEEQRAGQGGGKVCSLVRKGARAGLKLQPRQG